MKEILIVVDMQRDFTTGPLGTQEAQEIIPNIKEKVKSYEYENNEVYYTRDTHYDNYFDTFEGKKLPIKHCIYETPGWCIIDELNKTTNTIFNKNTFGSIDLAKYISTEHPTVGVVELCGVCTDICVVSNALLLRAFMPNTTIIVDAKACAGTTPEKHQAALEVMKSCQINVINF